MPGNTKLIFSSAARDFLRGCGEMGKAVSSKDWAQTPLGPIESWPQSLRTTVSLCLASNFPISLVWGPQCTQIYNDGYWPICGAKHPQSMGQDFRECWASAWPVIGEAFERAQAGETRFLENQRIFIDRNGYLEETFFTFSFSPIRDESGRVGGLFHPVTETTAKMLSERRTEVLRNLADDMSKAMTVEEAARTGTGILAKHKFDIPFALLYLFDEEGTQLHLAGRSGIEAGTAASPERIDPTQPDTAWPVRAALSSGQPEMIQHFAEQLGLPPGDPYPEIPDRAFVLPIQRPGGSGVTGLLIAGVSARLPLDESYRSFYILLAGQFATAIANARANEAERRRAEELAELDRTKTAFFSNISHEFRTPLTLMLGPLEEMLHKSQGQVTASRDEVDLVYRNGLRLLRLVNTLLDFSRIEAGRIQAVFEPVDLAVLTEDLGSVFRAAVEKGGLKYVVDCPPLSRPVYADPTMWEKIVLNLLSNAFKFTFSGAIRVTLQERGGRVELTVADTGTGIAAENLARLFERFYRVEGSRGRTHEGTGIGLSLVRELVKLHGGEVEVESELGKGATFRVSVPFGFAHLPAEQVVHVGRSSLPATTASHAAAYVAESLRWLPDRAETENGVGLEPRRRILLADDNADMRQYVKRLLEPEFEVEAVANGAEALRSARNRAPDLVLSDVMMPELDGFGLLSALRRDAGTRAIPVVLLSARAGEEARVEGLEAGADDYLVKPFGARELLARVRTNMELARLRNELLLEQERSRSAAEVERQWHIFDAVLSGTPDHAWVFDKERRFTYVNRALLELWQKEAGDVIGKKITDLGNIPRTLATMVEMQVERVGATGKAERYETEFTDPQGQTRSYDYILTPIFGEDGRVEKVAGTSRDITMHKQAEHRIRTLNLELEQRVRERTAQLEAANKELEAFAYSVSHDLRAPLRGIDGWSLALAEDYAAQLDERAQGYVGRVRSEAQRMALLIDDLLQLSRITRTKMKRARVDLAAIARRIAARLREANPQRKLRFEIDESLAAMGDAPLLEIALTNLLDNAVKFTAPRAEARIEVGRRQQGGSVFFVRDNGVGFDMARAENLFGAFQRLHKASDFPGTGIGLATVQRIVRLHGGRIWADSKPENGVMFSFTLGDS